MQLAGFVQVMTIRYVEQGVEAQGSFATWAGRQRTMGSGLSSCSWWMFPVHTTYESGLQQDEGDHFSSPGHTSLSGRIILYNLHEVASSTPIQMSPPLVQYLEELWTGADICPVPAPVLRHQAIAFKSHGQRNFLCSSSWASVRIQPSTIMGWVFLTASIITFTHSC